MDKPGLIDLKDVLEQQFASGAGEVDAGDAARHADEEITSASKEGVMVGEVGVVVFSADQIYRTQIQPDEGIDGEIEFRNAQQKITGLGYRVQLKAGHSHLHRLADGKEKFSLAKDHHEALWAGSGVVPVLLIIRTKDCGLLFDNVTDAIRAAQREAPGKPIKSVIFNGQPFTKEAVLRLREKRFRDSRV